MENVEAKYIIREIREEDIEEAQKLILRCIDEVNSKTEPKENIEMRHERYTLEGIRKMVSVSKFYVTVDTDKKIIVGTGAIQSMLEHENLPIYKDCGYVFAIYVLPDLHKNGLGRKMINYIENTDLFKKSRINYLTATAYGRPFYYRLG
jgi:GNAT superfamily N-acetyltransferase